MTRQMPGNGAFAGAGRPINRHNHRSPRNVRAKGAVLGTHPRFFVLGPAFFFAGAVKPYRFSLPALAPAAKAGSRLLPAERESGRASFLAVPPLRRRPTPRTVAPGLPAGLTPLRCPLPFPLRGLVAVAESLPFRTPIETLDVWLRPLPFPLPRVPLVELETVCEPARLPLLGLAPFPFQRAPEPGANHWLSALPRAGQKQLRDSGPERRVVRLLEEPCAGLRSREWAAGRLK